VAGTEPAHRPVWDSYYARLESRACIYGHPAYIRFLAKHYGDPAELFVYEEDGAFVYYPYFKRPLEKLQFNCLPRPNLGGRFDIHSSWYYGGPLFSSSADSPALAARFLREFRDRARSAGCVTEFARLDPNLASYSNYPADDLTFNRETVYVQLAGRSRAEIWQDFNDSNRWAINRARREGIVTVPYGASDHEPWARFTAIYDDEMQRKNAPKHLRFKEAFFNDLRTALPDNLCLLAAVKGGEMCGAHLIIFDECNAFAFLSATSFSYWGTQVNNFIWSEAIYWALEHGKKRYDLQGGRAGVFKFKAHFSPSRGRFYTLNAIHDAALYEALIVCCQSKDATVTSFPPYLV
jgi:hypothetical protein